MSPDQVKKSKFLSWLLRHGAWKAGVRLDEAGWTDLDEVTRVSGLSRQEIEDLARHDRKRRLQIEGGRIRACQGHTLASGVTVAGLEASWQPYLLDTPVWHGTSVEAAEKITREGILPVERTHVHCAPARDSVVGRSAVVHLLIQVDPVRVRRLGLALFTAPNGVVLARRIPREAITGLIPVTKRARQECDGLLEALGLPKTSLDDDPSLPTPSDPEASASDR